MPFVVRNESNYVESHLKFKNNIKLFHCALTRNLTIRKSNLKISILFYLKNHFIACSHTHAVVFLHYTVNMQTNKKLDPPFSTTARVHYRPHTYPASIRWVNVVQWRFFIQNKSLKTAGHPRSQMAQNLFKLSRTDTAWLHNPLIAVLKVF